MSESPDKLYRRRLIGLLGSVGTAGLAGCGQSQQGSTQTTTTSHTETETQTPTATTTDKPTETTTEADSDPIWKPRAPPTELPASEVLGITHTNGQYHFSSDDFLNEGAKKINELGTNVIKVWFHRISEKYPYNSDWADSYQSMVQIAKSKYVRELFNRPFSTYIILAHSYTWGEWLGFQDGVTDREMQELRDRFEALTRHLLETYDGTGKTFVLQHWEGDNLAQEDETEPLPEDVAENFHRWLTARQEGVETARDSVESDVTVLHSAEVNFVLDAKNSGTSRVINEVIPDTDIDLVSYSAWELGDQLNGEGWAPGHNGEKQFDEAESLVSETLDYIESKAPNPNEYVAGSLTERQSNVFLGEFGSPFQQRGAETAMRIIRSVLEHSLEWGVRWAIYWQLYCNEKVVDGEVTENDDVRGFYLIRPDGMQAPTWDYFSSIIQGSKKF